MVGRKEKVKKEDNTIEKENEKIRIDRKKKYKELKPTIKMNKAELDEHYEYFTKDNKNESDAIKREKNRAKFISSFKIQDRNN